MSQVVDHSTDEFASRVLTTLQAAKKLTIRPKRVEVRQDIDALGDEALRVLLVLPAPVGETWDRDAVFKIRRAAIDALDALVAEKGQTLPGRTLAMVTTDEANEADVAPEESPQLGEGLSL